MLTKRSTKYDGSARHCVDVSASAASWMETPQCLWLQGPAAFGFWHNLL